MPVSPLDSLRLERRRHIGVQRERERQPEGRKRKAESPRPRKGREKRPSDAAECAAQERGTLDPTLALGRLVARIATDCRRQAGREGEWGVLE
jgi:hypothetical protein